MSSPRFIPHPLLILLLTLATALGVSAAMQGPSSTTQAPSTQAAASSTQQLTLQTPAASTASLSNHSDGANSTAFSNANNENGSTSTPPANSHGNQAEVAPAIPSVASPQATPPNGPLSSGYTEPVPPAPPATEPQPLPDPDPPITSPCSACGYNQGAPGQHHPLTMCPMMACLAE